jgi:hypothetical protein
MKADTTGVSAVLRAQRNLERMEGRDRRRVPLPAGSALRRIRRAELDELLRDVQRYLAAVDVFRAEGLEPCWKTFAEGRGEQ